MEDSVEQDGEYRFERLRRSAENASRLTPHLSVSIASAEAFPTAQQIWTDGSDVLERLLSYQDRFAAGMDDRIRAAHLVSFYGHYLGMAAGAFFLEEGVVADLATERLGLRPETMSDGSGGLRLHFCFNGFSGEATFAGFHSAYCGSMEPMIHALARRTGLSAVAQWQLAGDALAGAFLDLGITLGDEEGAKATAIAILDQQGSPMASQRRRYLTVSAGSRKRTFRARGGCCLYYRTQGGAFCDVCVLQAEDICISRLQAHMDRAGG